MLRDVVRRELIPREAGLAPQYNSEHGRTSLPSRAVVASPIDRVVRNNIARIDHYISAESKIRAAYLHYPQRRRDIGSAHALRDCAGAA